MLRRMLKSGQRAIDLPNILFLAALPPKTFDQTFGISRSK